MVYFQSFVLPTIALCLLSMSILGCQLTKPPLKSVDPDVLVQFHISGGIAGLDDNLVILNNGQGTLTQPANEIEFELSERQLKELTSIIEGIQFNNLQSRYENPNTIDNLEYEIRKYNVIIYIDDGAVPPELEELVSFLNAIIVDIYQ